MRPNDRSNDRSNDRDDYRNGGGTDSQHRFSGRDSDDDRGLMDRANELVERAGDRVRSWFDGDDDGQRGPSDGRGGPGQDNSSRNFGQDGDESERVRAGREHNVGYSGQGYRGGMENYAHGNQGNYRDDPRNVGSHGGYGGQRH